LAAAWAWRCASSGNRARSAQLSDATAPSPLPGFRSWYATQRGRRAARNLGAAIAPAVRLKPNARLLALGYPAPMLTGLNPRRVERFALAMPWAEGAHRWPSRGPSCAMIADPAHLPFREALFDQAILVHALEFAPDPHALLRELWRILAPAGELLVIAPNRFGRRLDFVDTPFDEGRGWSDAGLRQLLVDAMFEPYANRTALTGASARALAPIGRAALRLAPGLGVVRLMLARKTDGLRPAMVGRAVRVTARAQTA